MPAGAVRLRRSARALEVHEEERQVGGAHAVDATGLRHVARAQAIELLGGLGA
jgi:hypothetical protein